MGLYDEMDYLQIGQEIHAALQLEFNKYKGLENPGQWANASGIFNGLLGIITHSNTNGHDAITLKNRLTQLLDSPGGLADTITTTKIEPVLFVFSTAKETSQQQTHALITALQKLLRNIPSIEVLKAKKAEYEEKVEKETLIRETKRKKEKEEEEALKEKEKESKLEERFRALEVRVDETSFQLHKEQLANSNMREAIGGFLATLLARSNKQAITGEQIRGLEGFSNLQNMGLIQHSSASNSTQTSNAFFVPSSSTTITVEKNRLQKCIERCFNEDGKSVNEAMKLTNRLALIEQLIADAKDEDKKEFAPITKMVIYYLIIWKYSHSIKEIGAFLVEKLKEVDSVLPESVAALINSTKDDLTETGYNKGRKLFEGSEVMGILVLHTGGSLNNEKILAYMPKDAIAEKCYKTPGEVDYFEEYKKTLATQEIPSLGK
jgi:hypothetical protein